ncbi:MAG: uncharacterized protein KVP18_002936, partial [Porospora cf. gigantea A]
MSRRREANAIDPDIDDIEHVTDPKRQHQLMEWAHEFYGHAHPKIMMDNIHRVCRWRNMKKTATMVYGNCRACRLQKSATVKGQHPPRPLPFYRVHADFVKLRPGYYMLIFLDAFSSWIEYQICADKTHQQFLEGFSEQILYRHGAPFVLVTDGGPEFVAKECAALLARYKIFHDITLPDQPQANGKAEKFIHLVKVNLKKVVNDDTQDDQLPRLTSQVVKDLRFRKSGQGLTPFHLCYGRLPRAPDDQLFSTMMVQSKPVELQPGDEVVVVNPNDLTTMVQAQPKVWIVQEATKSAASIGQADVPDNHDIVSTNRLKKLPKSRIQAQ